MLDIRFPKPSVSSLLSGARVAAFLGVCALSFDTHSSILLVGAAASAQPPATCLPLGRGVGGHCVCGPLTVCQGSHCANATANAQLDAGGDGTGTDLRSAITVSGYSSACIDCSCRALHRNNATQSPAGTSATMAERRELLSLLATEAGSQSAGRHCEWPAGHTGSEYRGAPKCVECDANGTSCTPLTNAQWCRESPGNAVHKLSMRKSSPRGPDHFRFGQKDTFTSSHWHDIRNCTIQNCFDLTRCPSATTDSPLAVYVYPPASADESTYMYDESWLTNCSAKVGRLLKIDAVAVARELAAAAHSPIRFVETPDEACLLVATKRSFLSPEAMTSSPTWNEGRNHLLWEYHYFGMCGALGWGKVMHPDGYPDKGPDIGYAALAGGSFTAASFRVGFDMSTPLRPL
jgi:hypothetical protein